MVQTLNAKDAKYGFGKIIDLARRGAKTWETSSSSDNGHRGVLPIEGHRNGLRDE